MKKVKVKAYAKINLILDVVGVEGNFHALKSLVCSIDLADDVIVKKRKDGKITLKKRGIPYDCPQEKDNAYRSAINYLNDGQGVSIKIKKRIPVGGGLGGSSADIAGVLNALDLLYDGQKDKQKIADQLGSDSKYMLKGGYAILEGRGDKITYLNQNRQFYLLVLTCQNQVSAKQSYAEFDNQQKTYPQACDQAVKAFNDKQFLSLLKNDLYPASSTILPQIKSNLQDLKQFGDCVMTGSGSAVVGVYLTKKQRDYAYKHLKKIHGDRLIKAKTITDID